MLNYQLLVVVLFFCEGFAQDSEENIISSCSKNEFECAGGGCVLLHDVCDGFKDCFDGSDETFIKCANQRCPPEISYQCVYGGCIDKLLKCDGTPHCPDGTDEDPALCGYPRCPNNTVQCASGGCIEVSKLCDGTNDCYDNSDEDPYTCQNVTIGESCFVPFHPINGWCFLIDCVTSQRIRDCFGKTLTKDYCIEFICQEGFILDKFKTKFISKCTKGKWNPQPPRCQACGVRHGIFPLIFNGKNVTRPEPWHVAIYHTNHNGNKTYICGGTIINSKAVVTAAHCVTYFDPVTKVAYINHPSSYELRVGKIYSNFSVYEENEQVLEVFDIKIRGVFDAPYNTKFANDIALMVVKNIIDLNIFITPACIQGNLYKKIIDSTIVGKVVGWGETETAKISKILLEAKFNIFGDYIDCRETMRKSSDKELVSADKFCIKDNSEGSKYLGQTLGQGDSGGGFIVENSAISYLYGVVSSRVSDDNLVTFTKVSYHQKWLLNELEMI